jgi:hypothetical protein
MRRDDRQREKVFRYIVDKYGQEPGTPSGPTADRASRAIARKPNTKRAKRSQRKD